MLSKGFQDKIQAKKNANILYNGNKWINDNNGGQQRSRRGTKEGRKKNQKKKIVRLEREIDTLKTQANTVPKFIITFISEFPVGQRRKGRTVGKSIPLANN